MEIERILEEHQQTEILEHLRWLAPDEKDELLNQIKGLDLPLIFQLWKQFRIAPRPTVPTIEPAPIITLPRTPAEIARRQKAKETGEELLSAGEVAVLVVAGGQGSRLGYNGPKGTFPISPLKGKSLFQLLTEKVLALRRLYGKPIPLLFMVNQENHAVVKQFFVQNHFFGLPPAEVFFFAQAILPSITPEGKLLLKDRTHLFVNPDGHGGCIKAFYQSGLLEEMAKRGITTLFYCQVDNPLVQVADPIFLGYHRQAEAEMSLKVLRRRDGTEKVGIYGLVNGKPAVVEYSDLPPAVLAETDASGQLRYWAGSIAIHAFSLAFLRRLNESGLCLPYHRAVKEVTALQTDGQTAPLIAWKFETFIFDSLSFAQRVCCVETKREDDFAPVKNKSGEDSPQTAQTALINLYRRWLAAAGIVVPEGVKVEISPLYALDESELVARVAKEPPIICGDTYLG